MSRTKMTLLLANLVFLSACSLLDPFIDRRREPGVSDISKLYVGESTTKEPAICYNKWTSELDQIQEMADKECRKHGTGTRAVATKQTMFTCRLLIPNHIYFECVE